MKRIKGFNIIILIMFFLATHAYGCTIIIGHKNGRVLVGNNEDWLKSDAKYWIEEPDGKRAEFRALFFGFNGDGKFPQGGINEAGLFFDGTVVPETPKDKALIKSKKLIAAPVSVFRALLKKYKNVAEAKDYLAQYHFPFIKDAQILIVDANGDYLIIKTNGIAESGTVKEGEFKIVTNFHLEELKANTYTCYRYDRANSYFNTSFTNTVPEFEHVLSLTHQEYPVSTVYSNVYDLSQSKVKVYYNGDFSKAHQVDLSVDPQESEVELEGGLFKVRMVEKLIKINKKGDHNQALNFFKKEINNQESKYIVDARQLIDFAEYSLFYNEAKGHEEILNVALSLYPKSDVVYESLGRLALRRGLVPDAITQYKKALALNSENWWAKDMIEQYTDQNPCQYSISLTGYEDAKRVSIEGDFNEWMPIRNVSSLENGVWKSCIRTKPGTYTYRVIVDGKEIENPGRKGRSQPMIWEVTF